MNVKRLPPRVCTVFRDPYWSYTGPRPEDPLNAGRAALRLKAEDPLVADEDTVGG